MYKEKCPGLTIAWRGGMGTAFLVLFHKLDLCLLLLNSWTKSSGNATGYESTISHNKITIYEIKNKAAIALQCESNVKLIAAFLFIPYNNLF